MAEKKNVLIIPPDYDGPIDPAVDDVRQDESAERPHVIQEKVSVAGEGVLDRDLVTDEKKSIIANSILAYEDAKLSGDTAAQLDSLEVAFTNLWDIVSGEDLGSALIDQQEKDSTDGSTPA
jgi:hypothetical protein